MVFSGVIAVKSARKRESVATAAVVAPGITYAVVGAGYSDGKRTFQQRKVATAAGSAP